MSVDLETIGGELIAALVASEKPLDDMLKLMIPDEVFRGDEKPVWEFAQEHLKKHGAFPARSTFLENGYDLPVVDEPPTYYLERLEKRHQNQMLIGMLGDIQDLLQAGKVEESMQRAMEMVSENLVRERRRQIVELTESLEAAVHAEIVAKTVHGKDMGIRTGWGTLDKFNFGMRPGDFYTMVGPTGGGKTWNLLWSAHHAWQAQHKKAMIVTNEMLPLEMMNRFAAIHTRVPFDQINKAQLNQFSQTKFDEGMKLVTESEVPCYIVDGNMTATVEDVVMLAHYLQPDAIYIDGAYMMKPSEKGRKSWEAVVDVARGLKQKLATGVMVPVFATYQFNKNAMKEAKKKKGDIGLEHVAGSQEIAWLSSVMLGITMGDSSETKDQKLIEVLKGRNGETGRFWTRFLFGIAPYMDFSEVETNPEALTFD